MIKKSIVVHPLLFAAYPVLFLYSHNPGEAAFHDTYAPLAVTVGLTLPVWLALGFVMKNWEKSGIIVSLFLVLFFSYGYFRTPLRGKELVIVMSSAWIAIFIFGSFFIAKSRKDFITATTLLNVIAGILIAMPVLDIIIFYRYGNVRRPKRDVNLKFLQTDLHSAIKKQSYPDIYFIILDAYAREDILREIYDFDNSGFLNFLRKKGFYIADKSVSNYCQTGLSIGACFNLSYLDGLANQIGQDSKIREPLEKVVRESFILDYLRKHGYKIVAFASGRPETELLKADYFLKPEKSVNMFHNAVKNMTPLPDILVIGKSYSEFDKFRQKILFILDNLGKVAGTFQSPKFVFAHIEAPHPPFVFGPDGEPRNPEARLNDLDGNWIIRPGRLTVEEYRRYYIDQLVFINGRMEKVVNEILENSKQPPIIMILGDHGPRSEVVWESVEKTNVRECLSILNAYYLPDNGEKLLYPQITPVNSFRVIFKHYFGEQSNLLADKSYFSEGVYLYKFYDVTERVQEKHR
jgi:hypothetical protein